MMPPEARPHDDKTMRARFRPVLWILVAGSQSARLYQSDGKGDLRLIGKTDHGDVTLRLESGIKARHYDRLVMVAAKPVLNSLRKMMSATVQDMVLAEIGKNLSNLPDTALRMELEKIVWF